MEATLVSLRELIAAGGARRPGRRFSSTLQRRISDYARKRRAAGVTWLAIAAELDMSADTLRKWSEAAPATPTAQRPMPVRVVNDQPAASLFVLTPKGFRVEGLTVESAARLLTLLG